jgi:hypothetical protein
MTMDQMTLAVQRWPMNVVFDGIGSLEPKDDITPKEAVQLTMMLVCASANSFVDFPAFVKEHGLERHFTQGKER